MKVRATVFALALVFESCEVDGVDSHDCDDLNIYFNKFDITENFKTHQHLLPLRADGYPISRHKEIVTMLKEDSTGMSVVDDMNDYEITYNTVDLIEKVGGLPDHPSRNKGAKYWDKLDEVIDMQLKPDDARADSELVDKMMLPLRWKDYTVHDVAEAVHDEYPGLHQREFIEDLMKGLYGEVDFDSSIIPRRSSHQYLREIMLLADFHMQTIGLVGPNNFSAKWYSGRARPEEIAWKIKSGDINSNTVPSFISEKIARMDFTRAESFTRYEEGSPRHPSWPAMHSAASNISFWLQIVMNLTPHQLCEAKKVDYAVAYARTVAGVHFSDDNTAGLNMGQVIVAMELPSIVAERFGTNIDVVKKKIASKRFNWNDYDPLEVCPSALQSVKY